MEIVRYKQVNGDRIREMLATSSERVIYDRSDEWQLIEDDAESDEPDGDEPDGDGSSPWSAE